MHFIQNTKYFKTIQNEINILKHEFDRIKSYYQYLYINIYTIV